MTDKTKQMMRGVILRKYNGERARLNDVMGHMINLEYENGGGAWMHEDLVYDFWDVDEESQEWVERCPHCHQPLPVKEDDDDR